MKKTLKAASPGAVKALKKIKHQIYNCASGEEIVDQFKAGCESAYGIRMFWIPIIFDVNRDKKLLAYKKGITVGTKVENAGYLDNPDALETFAKWKWQVDQVNAENDFADKLVPCCGFKSLV
ncbi:hypothetical protein CFBP4996_28515 (plasmid) [Agrobacterium leguminum]|uniref:Uncharacterized protein n=1 Tax=Agrobacterium deltaense NCPPB 1641 TaxID=1183425 RepID=A0A1S7UAN9_9HYPH|nr:MULTISPECIES: hypothetical protein [Agrobacterium]WFS69682.1 hypothetical protein CFBP4996_28515 [Agrobacterium leguminum]CVI63875.1 hypothetical protein AGR7A_pAt30014 [Agrobacterium deltaense NCPPB 1641]